MKIEELTIKEAREIAQLFSTSNYNPNNDSHWQVGKNYFIRTVTHHLTGKLVKVAATELVMENAAWIADDGNFTDAMQKAEFSEVEMFDPNQQVIIGRGSLIDAQVISEIPTSRK